MDIPLIMALPQSPSRADGPAAFNALADPFIAALPPFALQMNVAIQWLAAAMATVLDYKNAAATSAGNAADSAIRAGEKVGLAADQVDLAVAARQGAEAALASSVVVAAAVQDAAGIPSLAGNAGKVLTVNAGATGVEWKALGQAIGDILQTTRTPDATYILTDTVYSRAAYPELFAIVGTQDAFNDAANFTSVSNGLGTGPFMQKMAVGKDGVIVAVGYSNSGAGNGRATRSTDGGLTWNSIPTLSAVWSLNSVATDGNGVWVATEFTNANGYRSTDNGATWSAAFPLNGMSQSSAANGTFVTTNKAGLWIAVNAQGTSDSGSKSVDNGVTWTAITGIPVTVTSFTTDAAGNWFVITNNSTLRRSTDNGATWKGSLANVTGNISIGGGVIAVPISGIGVAVSTDGGATFKPSTISTSSAVAIVDPLGVIYLSSELRIYKSYDAGVSWTVSASVLTFVNYGYYAITSAGVWILAGPSGGNFYRATRQYNYDVTTQFKTPRHVAPKGYAPYIKGKLL